MEYWNLVKAADIAALTSLLSEKPELVKETYPGEAANLELEAESPFTNTALHFAALGSHHELASALLAAGADVNALGYAERFGLAPPLLMATGESDVAMVELLLDHGADPNLEGSAEGPLYCAIESGEEAKVQLLLARGARHDVFTAAMAGEVDLVLYHLRAYPGLLQARTRKRQRTPWDEAATHEQDDVMAAIRRWTEEGKEEQAQAEVSWGGEVLWGAGEEPETPLEVGPNVEASDGADDWSDWVEEGSSWPG